MGSGPVPAEKTQGWQSLSPAKLAEGSLGCRFGLPLGCDRLRRRSPAVWARKHKAFCDLR